MHLEQGQSAASNSSIPQRLRHAPHFATRLASTLVAGLATSLLFTLGCGNTYRPVVNAINPVGPAGQPQKYAVAVSSASATSNGLVTLVDFSGDTVLATPSIGVNPYYFILNSGGTTGYTLNSDQTLTTFDISPSLQTNAVLESTLPSGANPVSLFPSSASTYIAQPGRSTIGQYSGTPPSLKQEFPVAANPIYVVGQAGATRAYAISQGSAGSNGSVAAIETSGNTISNTIPVGRGPVYGVMSSDYKRAFILNQTDGTVTVINSQTNVLDAPLNTIPVGVAPIWADLAPSRNELVVVNQGNGTSPGTVSIVNIPLCSAVALATNPACDPTNPNDATSFGQVVATIPVGINPFMVSVLSDGTRAYVANAGVANLPCAAVPVAKVSTACTISVVNLTSNTVTATIPVNGHPAYLATTNSTPTGKVYVVARDSTVMTVIRTDEDIVSTTIPLQGFGISVRVTAP